MQQQPYIRYPLEIVPSTNDWAKTNRHLFPKNKIHFITAKGQTAGRGTLDRRWHSPENVNIYATFSFFFPKSQKNSHQISHLILLSAIEILEKWKLPIRIKWPNDLFLEGKKIGGVLGEVLHEENHLFFLGGIGLNVNMDVSECASINQPAISLKTYTGHSFDVEALSLSLAKTFCKKLQLFLKEGFTPFFTSFKDHLLFKENQQLTLYSGNQFYYGVLEKVQEDSSITMRLEDSTLKTFYAGEFF